MKISIIGAGRVGLPLGGLLAESGCKVFITDKNPKRKQAVKGQDLTYSAELKDLIKQNQANMFWTESKRDILSNDFIFFCLNTPVKKSGELDLHEVFCWVKMAVQQATLSKRQKEQFLIIKSTLPLGTNRKLQDKLKDKKTLNIITCPEFLRQGQALSDLKNPERLVIGARTRATGQKLEELYKKFSHPKKIIQTDPETAELSKLASNSFLAVKISFANEWSQLCESLQGNPQKLKLILESDPRMGKGFLTPGLGYGGTCLPKDVALSLYEGKAYGHKMRLLKSAQKINSSLYLDFFKVIKKILQLRKSTLAFYGISFKKGTDDLKNSPALALLCRLLRAGAECHVYDPLFVKERVFMFLDKNRNSFQEDSIKFLRKKIFAGKLFFHKKALDALPARQALIVASDWDEFKIPLGVIKKKLARPLLVDGRGLFPTEDLKREGFEFYQKGSFFIQKRGS